jgi:hypothetical protein
MGSFGAMSIDARNRTLIEAGLNNPVDLNSEVVQRFLQGGGTKKAFVEGCGVMRVNAATRQSIATACRACGETGAKMPKCSRCETVSYCSKECQARDWPTHKKMCKQMKANNEAYARVHGLQSRDSPEKTKMVQQWMAGVPNLIPTLSMEVAKVKALNPEILPVFAIEGGLNPFAASITNLTYSHEVQTKMFQDHHLRPPDKELERSSNKTIVTLIVNKGNDLLTMRIRI